MTKRENDMKKSLGAKTLAVPCPVWVIGTYDKEGKANIATAAWGGICCSQPPSVAVSFRKATHTYHAILQRQAFTVNIPAESQVVEADFAGINTGRDIDKFAACSLTPVRSELVDAPYVEEFPLILECRVTHTLEIGLHTQFIGEIVDVKVDSAVQGDKGYPDITKVKPFIWDSAHTKYFALGACLGQAWDIGKKLSGGRE
jgi:flavin reductase (DIM6/NTAB) family NADH-FMN oxidoreductase RutF